VLEARERHVVAVTFDHTDGTVGRPEVEAYAAHGRAYEHRSRFAVDSIRRTEHDEIDDGALTQQRVHATLSAWIAPISFADRWPVARRILGGKRV
jgi:hypothetical protein